MSAKRIKLPFGLKDGVILHVSEVQKGIACKCKCANCGDILIARKGTKVTHHFAHEKGSECAKALETALHFAAKQILATQRKIKLPPVQIKFASYREPVIISQEQVFTLDEVHLENRTETIVPDILAYHNKTPLMLEILVTHAVDDIKLEKIKQTGISTIEIDLSTACRNFSHEELIDLVVNQTTNKKWIFNRKTEYYTEKFLRTGDRKKIVHRGFASHVDHCPLYKRIWKGQSYANFIDDCACCEFLLQASSGGEIICGGRNKIRTFDELKEFYSPKQAPYLFDV